MRLHWSVLLCHTEESFNSINSLMGQSSISSLTWFTNSFKVQTMNSGNQRSGMEGFWAFVTSPGTKEMYKMTTT